MTLEELAGVAGVVSLLIGAGYKIHAAQSARFNSFRLETKADNAKLHAKLDKVFERIAEIEKDSIKGDNSSASMQELKELRVEIYAQIDKVDDRLSSEVQAVREQVIVQLKAFRDSMLSLASIIRKGGGNGRQ